MIFHSLLTAFLLFLLHLSLLGAPGNDDSNLAGPKKDAWVERILKQMNIEEKVAQMVFARAESGYLSRDDERWIYLERMVRERKIGGFVFFAGDVYEYAVQANKLQSLSKIPLLIAADFEFGAAMRVRRATLFPRAMLVGATRNPQHAYEIGKITAREAKALGVHQVYGPVVDVNNNPKNPVINTRAFGDNSALVSEMSIAFIKGMQEEGVIATAKHFPGHGDTDIDSHLDLPVLPFSSERLDSLELVGFRKAIEADVKSIMVAHLDVPLVDSMRGVPATLSFPISTTLLQERLGFRGLVVTDAMEMRSVTKAYSTAEAAVRAVKAGSDLILLPPDVDVAIDAIVKAVKRKEITIERINNSVRKILAAKKFAGLHKTKFIDVDAVAKVVGAREHKLLAKQIAREGITVVKNDSAILPLEKNVVKKIVSVAVGDNQDPGTGFYFRSLVRQRGVRVEDLRVDQRSNKLEYDSVLARAATADILLIHMYVRTRSAQMTGFLQPQQIEFLNNIMKLAKPTVVVSLGNPYILGAVASAHAYVVGYSEADVVIESAVEVLFGETPSKGKMPISLPGFFAYGDGIELPKVALRFDEPEFAGFDPKKLKKVDEVLKDAIADSAFPSAVLLAARDGVVGYNKAFGTFDYDPYSRRVESNTIYDLASVTKVVATTNAIMKLTQEGKLKLEDRVATYIPQFAQNGKDSITIYNLMVHNSGLPAWRKYYEFCPTTQCVLDSIYASPLVYKTGDTTIYSDLGLITVGKVIEKISGTTLNRYVDSVFFKPLGMSNTMFNPPAWLQDRIAPTEVDTHWQKTNRAIRGRVHDENAAVLGGVSGHAGLFSTASDFAVMMQMLLNGGTYSGRRYLQEETVRQFTTRQSEKSSRAIGWDTKTSDRSFSGRLTSMSTYLHTGFTGTSVVVDPERNLIIIFLTNRVHPTRSNTRIFDVRPKVHEAVVEAIAQ